jgi:Fe-S-cluster containining protein
MLPIKSLPIIERWQCAGCARCCRGSLIWLTDQDLAKLSEQGWERNPEYAGTKTVVREGWFGGRQRLAQRGDGSCVFLLPDGRCRIHADFGPDAKPLACRMFPLQLVPLERHALLTLRRACPTAAADQGPEVREYQSLAEQLAKEGCLPQTPVLAPTITRGGQRSWQNASLVAASLDRLVSNDTFPLVRRLAHALRFCALLDECHLKRLDSSQLGELCSVLEESCYDVGELFQQRVEPSGPAKVLFRQSAAEYVRLHPTFAARNTWRERWRMARFALAMARGKGNLPRYHPDLPQTTFDALERPLGHLDEVIQRPWLQFFTTQVVSRQYAIASRPGWPLVESFRALVLAYPIALWLLRWLAADTTPHPSMAVDIVTMLDRGQGYAPLTSAAHRSRVRTLTRLGQLDRLVAWFAR